MPALLTLIGIVVILGYHRASEAKRYKANIVEAPSSYGYPQQVGSGTVIFKDGKKTVCNGIFIYCY